MALTLVLGRSAAPGCRCGKNLNASYGFADQHSEFIYNFAPSVRFCLLGPPNASDRRPRKPTAARELSRTTESGSKQNAFRGKKFLEFLLGWG